MVWLNWGSLGGMERSRCLALRPVVLVTLLSTDPLQVLQETLHPATTPEGGAILILQMGKLKFREIKKITPEENYPHCLY